MRDTWAATLLAAEETGTGASGFLVVLLLIIASIGLFVLLSGSLRRMRANVDSGEFGKTGRARSTDTSKDTPAGAQGKGAQGAEGTGGDKATAVPGPRSAVQAPGSKGASGSSGSQGGADAAGS